MHIHLLSIESIAIKAGKPVENLTGKNIYEGTEVNVLMFVISFVLDFFCLSNYPLGSPGTSKLYKSMSRRLLLTLRDRYLHVYM